MNTAEKEVLVKVEGVSKKFCKNLKRSLVYGGSDIVKGFCGIERSSDLRKDEFWALNDVSFEVRRGECIGLIGHNGAGKSTLLKLLNGLILPDKGTIEMRGKVGALIELGAGFSPMQTGRENVYNNGAVLGFTKEEIDSNFDKIVEFAELKDFIDTPVQNYSSGMKVRLGFSVAAQMKPDILLIDEVLAVGDMGFVLKCFKLIDTILPNTALIFVSHSMQMVGRISSQIVLLNKGQAKYQGPDVARGIDAYYSLFKSADNPDKVFDDQSLELLESRMEDKALKDGYYDVKWNESVTVEFRLRALKKIMRPTIYLAFYDNRNRGVAEAMTIAGASGAELQEQEIFTCKVRLNNVCLTQGLYSVTFTASAAVSKEPMLKMHKALKIHLSDDSQLWTSYKINTEIIE